MIDTRDLEKRWIKYKIKSYIPHAVILISVVIIISVVLFLINSNVKQTTQQVILKASTDKNLIDAIAYEKNLSMFLEDLKSNKDNWLVTNVVKSDRDNKTIKINR